MFNGDALQPPVTTAVLKLDLHCAGCIEKIFKAASKTKGRDSIILISFFSYLNVTVTVVRFHNMGNR